MSTVNSPIKTNAAPQPQIIYIKEEKESFVSKGIGNAMGPFVQYAGLAGFVAGALTGLLQRHSHPLVTAVVGASVVAGVATIGVNTLQAAADFGVNATIYTVKLPFRGAAYLISGTATGIQSAYNSIRGENSTAKEEDITSEEALALKDKIA